MRRLVLGVSSVVLALVVGLAPAQGASSVVIAGTGANASDLRVGAGMSCSPTAASMPSVPGADWSYPTYGGFVSPRDSSVGITPEFGSRFLQYDGAAGEAHGPLALLGSGNPPSAVSARVAAPAGSHVAMGVVVGWGGGTDSGNQWIYIGWRPLASLSPSWSTAGFTDQDTFTWYSLTYNGGWNGPKTMTPAALAASVPAVWSWRAGIVLGCGDASPVDIDGLTVVGARSGPITADFEGLPTDLAVSASSTSTTYGRPLTISASARQGGSPAAVPLQVVRCQASTCEYVGPAVSSSASGPVTFHVVPEPGWSYGVRYPGDDIVHNPAQADVGTIAVSPYLSAGLSQRSVHAGDQVRVGGVVGPCTGATRHLMIQRKVAKKWKRVGRVLASACAVNGTNQHAALRGAFRATATGVWRLRVVAPASGGYATAVSRILRVRVTHAPVRHVTTPVHFAPVPTPAHTTTTTPAPPPPR